MFGIVNIIKTLDILSILLTQSTTTTFYLFDHLITKKGIRYNEELNIVSLFIAYALILFVIES